MGRRRFSAGRDGESSYRDAETNAVALAYSIADSASVTFPGISMPAPAHRGVPVPATPAAQDQATRDHARGASPRFVEGAADGAGDPGRTYRVHARDARLLRCRTYDALQARNADGRHSSLDRDTTRGQSFRNIDVIVHWLHVCANMEPGVPWTSIRTCPAGHRDPGVPSFRLRCVGGHERLPAIADQRRDERRHRPLRLSPSEGGGAGAIIPTHASTKLFGISGRSPAP